MEDTLRIGLVGLGFGAEFVPIYLHHPLVSSLVLSDPDPQVLRRVADRYEVPDRASSLQELLVDPSIDVIHLVSPIPHHADQTVAVLESGKHCACTVPMATTLEDIERILAARNRSGTRYMMMETAVYTREYLEASRLFDEGVIGRIQLLRGAHYQDMENWPPYWLGLPPMHYATHALAPLLTISDTRVDRVACLGSGVMRDELHEQYGNPYPIETAQFRLVSRIGPPQILAAELTRSLFHTAKQYTESFTVYGERATFEWQQIEGEQPVLFVMDDHGRDRETPVTAERHACPDRQDLLPPEIRRFTQRGAYDETNPHRSFLQGGGHGGSHPHLVHEFVSSIVEDREPAVGAVRAAQITAAGICAHHSAMKGGEPILVPSFGG